MTREGDWKDHFSHASDDYRRWRPRYPRALFEWLASVAPAMGTAWDAACGNGQASTGLAEFFERVVATDASAAQVAEAEAARGVEYSVAPAEQCPLADGSADVATVAQALHWLDVERFHAEVRRVLRPGGVVAEWAYGLAVIDAAIDSILDRFSNVTVGPHWLPERALVESGYAGVPFPFAPIAAPPIRMTAHWDLARMMAYLGTWSSVNRFRGATGTDPLPELARELAPAWGDREREVRWPLVLRAGRVER